MTDRRSRPEPAGQPSGHACTVCRDLPVRPFDPADVDPEVEYRPARPRLAPHGGPRSRRCTSHERAQKRASRARGREVRRERVYGLPAPLALALWALQGSACPCGRKAGPTPPAGVHVDHDHDLAVEHDHLVEQGCPDCVTGFLCSSCNRDIVGRLTRHWPRRRVAEALRRLADHLDDPPMARLRRDPPP